jgi:GNAT superfamily N-acetyltransferase
LTESALARPALGRIEKLAAHHDARAFDCGRQELNQFLQRFALPSQQSNSSKTYVVCRNWRIVGYYSLAVGAVAWGAAPPRTAKGLARHPIPIMILARLAVDRTEQGKGLGRALLKDALVRTAHAADIAGIRALVVHAKDEDARRWYEQFNFDPSPSDPLHLFLVIKDLKRLIAAAGAASASIVAQQPPAKAPKIMKVGLCLCIENNSKWVRGKKRAREQIERWVLSHYNMEKSESHQWDYILTIPYYTDEELDSIIYDEIIAEAAGIADDRHCFIEPFVCSLDDPDRSW